MKNLTLQKLIVELYKVFESDSVNIEQVKQLMSSYQGDPAEWSKYAKYEPGKYTRNLVNEGNGKFNLMILCWSGSVKSSIHDHADAHCFMRLLAGDLTEVRYDWPHGKAMQLRDESTMLPGDVCYINNEIGLHRVENRAPEIAVSLHLYSPPFSTCYMFDENTGKKVISKVTFWSRYGERTPIIQTREP
ncbi:cysteine dioxygenase type 1-like [Varroa jacobsoni]|uniref:Cysteine dioxygenase n=1 Tax=Varroa destructor TaxID=109461 RepID=A0A7M7JI69_VARDE|nr:cysteine dioxygenase type 1-like [Varroa destructor]XP_022701575.1 cysteine dioxygenase type 1-like [Varroa jacobsoni]